MHVTSGRLLTPFDIRFCAPRSASAFTLIEVLVVLGLLLLLAGISWPLMESQITASELPESGDRLCSALFMARSEAVLENRRYRIRFSAESQQPLIERESDPIRFPGIFESASSAWAEEPILLSNVQVHHVVLGQPAWTKPLSRVDDASTIKEEQKELEEDDTTKRERQRFLRGLTVDDAEADEETRPIIVFEADGSTDWATLVLAKLAPDEELEETTPQIWIVLDGRTGLARVRAQITEEQLSDPEFYVEWEKLDLPDTVDISDLSFTVGEEELAGGEEQAMEFTQPGQTQGGDAAGMAQGEGEDDQSATMMGGEGQRPRRQFQDLGSGGSDRREGGEAGPPPGGRRGGRGRGEGNQRADGPPPGERRSGGRGDGNQGGGRPDGGGRQGGNDTGSRQDRGGGGRDRGNLTNEERQKLDEWIRQNR